MPDQVPPEVVRERFQRLLELQERISLEANRALVGTEVELLVERSASKTDPTRMSGRTRTNKLCHFPARAAIAVGTEGPGARMAAGRPAGGGAGGDLASDVGPGDPGSGASGPGRGRPVDDLVAPGDLVTVRVEQAAPHHLIGGPVQRHRPWRPAGGSCAVAPAPRPLPAGAVPLPLVG